MFEDPHSVVSSHTQLYNMDRRMQPFVGLSAKIMVIGRGFSGKASVRSVTDMRVVWVVSFNCFRDDICGRICFSVWVRVSVSGCTTIQKRKRTPMVCVLVLLCESH